MNTYLQGIYPPAPKLQIKENPAYQAIMSVYGRGQAIWTPRDYANLSKAGYQYCATVYACVSKIAKGASRIAWILAKKRGEAAAKEIEDHPLLRLIAKPNEFEGGSRHQEKVLSFLLLAGNSYITKIHGVPSAPPVFLYSLRPDRMTILPGNWRVPIAGYEYRAGGIPVPFKAENVLHLKEFHPTDDFYGLSRLEVAARAIDISNKSMEWNKKLLDNDMRPSGIIKLNPALTQEQFDDFVTKFNERYSGQAGAGSVPIFNAGADWQSTGISPKDLDWSSGQKDVMRQICAIFDVPSQLLGDTENTTYSNMQEARRALYMEAILPLMDLYRDEMNFWLTPLFADDLKLDYDRDKIEALQEERAAKYTYLAQADWLKINEKRVATSYDEVGPEGDVILVGLGKVPLEQAVAEPEPVPDALKKPVPDAFKPAAGAEDENAQGGGNGAVDESTQPDQGKKAATGLSASRLAIPGAIPSAKGAPGAGQGAERRTFTATGYWAVPGRRKALWTTFELRVKTREQSFSSIAKTYLKRQAEEIRNRARSASNLSVLHPEDLLNVNNEAKKYVKAFWPWYRDHFIRAGNAGIQATKGLTFDDAEFKADDPTSWVFTMTAELEVKLRKMVFESGTEVNKTAIEEIYSILKRGNADNLTVSEFAKQIYEKLSGYEFERWRAMLWSRTESTKVDNFGQLESFKETEFVEKKGWMSTFAPTSRDTHMAADGQEVDIDDDFEVGGERLAYPGDPKGNPENVCNCLCGIYPVVGEAGG